MKFWILVLHLQNGHTAVDLATINYHPNLLLECKSQGALLRAASEDGDTSIVQKLLNEGADVNSRDIVSSIVHNAYLLCMCIYILSRISL